MTSTFERPSLSDTTGPVASGADAHGNPMSGSASAVDLYDRAVDRLLRFSPEVLVLLGQLLEEHGDAPMAQVLGGYLSLSGTDTTELPEARAAAARLGELSLNDREAAHAEVLASWLRGDWQDAADRLDGLLTRWPSDLLGLQIGHQLDFFLGDATNLRDRVGRSLGSLDPTHPHHGFMLGMHAFGLEEAGTLDAAEEAGMAALAANPDDVWAVHAVAHVHEMRGDVDRGIRFMTDRKDGWATDNFFSVHLWWHHALYLLEAGRHADVLGIYDRQVHNTSSAGVPIEMLDASALLWRLRLAGIDTGNRFAPLADAWAPAMQAGPWYVFNDVHAVMAMCGADRLAEARTVIDRLDRSLAASPLSGREPAMRTNRMMTTQVGLPVARSLVAHAEGRYDDVVGELLPIRRRVHRFGGSHAQRDVVEQTLLDAAVRSGQRDVAAALVRERLSRRDSSVVGWTGSARLASARGDLSAEHHATDAASRWQARFASAI